MPDLTNMIGQHGCSINYDNSVSSYSYSIRAMLERAANSAPIGTGKLLVPTGKGDFIEKTFRVLCVDYAQGWYQSPNTGPRYVIHPDDTGWVVNNVHWYMRDGMKPIRARISRNIFTRGRWLTAPTWATWVDTKWTCPNCVPKMQHDYPPGPRTWSDTACEPTCSVASSPNQAITRSYGYDQRVMGLWVSDLAAQPNCHQNLPGDGTELRDANAPVCLPMPIGMLDECRDLDNVAAKYWEDFWTELGAAIIAWNAAASGAETAQTISNQPPAPPPPPPTPLVPPPPPPPLVTSARPTGTKMLPLIIAGVTVLAASTILLRRRA